MSKNLLLLIVRNLFTVGVVDSENYDFNCYMALVEFGTCEGVSSSPLMDKKLRDKSSFKAVASDFLRLLPPRSFFRL